MSLHATYLGANGWLLEFTDSPNPALRVLVDPWLRGPLVFPPGAWLLKGELADPQPIPEAIDMLVLTQGLADHSHPESLSLLSRTLPVVASPTAAAVVRRLGFTTVTTLRPGQRESLPVRREEGIPSLTVTATAGASVPQQENGYLMDHAAGRIYLEPHGFLDASLTSTPVDAVITPVVNLGLPLAGTIIRGRQSIGPLLKLFQPRTLLASTTGGDVRFQGLLSGIFRQEGSTDEACALIETTGGPRSCRFINPVPGQRYALATG
jgi:L-ascorbate metabolism protein UlaG (beta-lactamase superfamily)